MAKAKKKTARKAVAAALKVMENMTFATTDHLDAQIKQVREKLSPLGMSLDFGTIVMAGRHHDRSYLVQIDIPSTGNNPGQYSTHWPEWAYGVAEGALRFNKQVFVVYNGVPTGANLILVYCLDTVVRHS